MKEIITSLDRVPIGSKFRIFDIDNTLKIKRRLSELGFCKDALADKLHVGFMGSPIACRICGAVIAVRNEDAEKIRVKCFK